MHSKPCLISNTIRDHWLNSIAESWLTGDGLNNPEEINDWLNTIQPIKFATECLDGWFEGEFSDHAPTAEELATRFADLAADRTWLHEVYARTAKSAL